MGAAPAAKEEDGNESNEEVHCPTQFGRPISQAPSSVNEAIVEYPSSVDLEEAWSPPRQILEQFHVQHSVSVGSAQAQVVNGCMIWPEHWGITRSQIKDLLIRLRQDAGWRQQNTVYDLVQEFVIPWTQGGGLGYALSVNADAPKQVNVMVSHAWGENAEEFLETVLRSVNEDEVLFICALAIYQAEDGCGPTIEQQLGSDPLDSPFRRVLKHVRVCGQAAGWSWRWRSWLATLPTVCFFASGFIFYLPVLRWRCMPSFTHCVSDAKWSLTVPLVGFLVPINWQWSLMPPWFPVFLVSAIVLAMCAITCSLMFRRIYPGRMIVVPNRELDIYSRLWCVYEMHCANSLDIDVEVACTLAHAGFVNSEHATCSSSDDTARIRSEIEGGRYSYADIDNAVMQIRRGAWRSAATQFAKYGFLICGCAVVSNQVMYTSGLSVCELIFEEVLSTCIMGSVVYIVCRRSQGAPLSCTVLKTIAVLAVLGTLLKCTKSYFIDTMGLALLSAAGYILVLIVGANCCPRYFQLHGRIALFPVVVLFVLFAIWMQLTIPGNTPGDEYYPTLVSSASYVGLYWVPLYACWSAAIKWGVHMRVKR